MPTTAAPPLAPAEYVGRRVEFESHATGRLLTGRVSAARRTPEGTHELRIVAEGPAPAVWFRGPSQVVVLPLTGAV